MEERRVIEVKKNILAANDEAADAFRAARADEGTFFVDVMASPGAGKTTLLLALIAELRRRGVADLGVIEADLESDVDALKIKEAGVASVELNTLGVCHVEMGMVERAFNPSIWEAEAGGFLSSWRTSATSCARPTSTPGPTPASCC